MNDITELRTHLFETLRGLKDKEAPMDIERAKAVSDVAKTLIDSARVECDFLKITGQNEGTGFIQLPEAEGTYVTRNPLKGTTTTVSLLEGARVTRHVSK